MLKETIPTNLPMSTSISNEKQKSHSLYVHVLQQNCSNYHFTLTPKRLTTHQKQSACILQPQFSMGHVENSTIFHQKVADVPTSLGVKYGRD